MKFQNRIYIYLFAVIGFLGLLNGSNEIGIAKILQAIDAWKPVFGPNERPLTEAEVSYICSYGYMVSDLLEQYHEKNKRESQIKYAKCTKHQMSFKEVTLMVTMLSMANLAGKKVEFTTVKTTMDRGLEVLREADAQKMVDYMAEVANQQGFHCLECDEPALWQAAG